MLQNFLSSGERTCAGKLVSTRLHCQRLVHTCPVAYLAVSGAGAGDMGAGADDMGAGAGDIGSETRRRTFFADSGVQYDSSLEARFWVSEEKDVKTDFHSRAKLLERAALCLSATLWMCSIVTTQ